MIIAEDDCEIYILGFKYLDEFYWRPKNDLLKASPSLINPIVDLILEEIFGSYEIDLTTVFTDPEGDEIFLFALSDDTDLISTDINGQQLVLTGTEKGSVSIVVTAVDANGGVVTDEFVVQVNGVLSSNDIEGSDISVSFF